MPVKRSAIVLVPLVTAGIAGCASVEREFDGSPTNQVWSALVAAAESPEYDGPDPADRWTVVENEVWIAPEEGRIEIYRRLKRYLHPRASR